MDDITFSWLVVFTLTILGVIAPLAIGSWMLS